MSNIGYPFLSILAIISFLKCLFIFFWLFLKNEFFLYWVGKLFMYSRYKSFIGDMFCICFLLVSACFFISWILSFVGKSLILMKSFIFSFGSCLFNRSLLNPKWQKCFPVFSSRSFMMLVLRSFIHSS